MTTRIDFTYSGWDCWYHPFHGWGALLSRSGLKMKLITRCANRQDLISRIDEAGIMAVAQR